MPMRKSKTVPFSERYNHYLTAMRRELLSADTPNPSPLRAGRIRALTATIRLLEQYQIIYTEDNPDVVHKLLERTQENIEGCQNTYSLTPDADERMRIVGTYNEYKRQVEQIRKLLTPMKVEK